MKKYDISRRDNSECHYNLNLPINEISLKYEKGISLSKLGVEYNVSRKTIRKHLERNGIKIRTHDEQAKIEGKSIIGENHPMFGKHHTEEAKNYITEKTSGTNNPRYGKHCSKETKNKISIKALKRLSNPENHPNWKGGVSKTSERLREYDRKHRAKRRQLNYIPLNKAFNGSVGHHIDKEHVIHIPTELHLSISHCLICNSPKNMLKINKLALDFLCGKIDFDGKEI